MDSHSSTDAVASHIATAIDSLHSSTEEAILKILDETVDVLNQRKEVCYELKVSELWRSLTHTLSHPHTLVRAATYRLLRHILLDVNDILLIHQTLLSLFLIRSLSRDHAYDVEKEYALRFIRHVLFLPDLPENATFYPVDPAVIRGVVAVAESPEEKWQMVALETLSEMAIRHSELLAEAGGFRVLLRALSDGPYEISTALALVFVHVMDRPQTRRFLHPGVDLESVFSTFSGASGVSERRLSAHSDVIVLFLRSWSGLIYLSSNGGESLRSLVASLDHPSLAIQTAVVALFKRLLGVGQHYVSDEKRPQMNGHSGKNIGASFSSRSQSKSDVSDPNATQHTLLLLALLIHSNLVSRLADVVLAAKDATLVDDATALLQHVLALSARILPNSYAAEVHSLPAFVESVVGLEQLNKNATTAPATDRIPSLGQLPPPSSMDASRSRSSAARPGAPTPPPTSSETFRAWMVQSNVLATKEWAKWDLSVLFQLLQGPLKDPKRLDEAMNASKWMRRLLSFLAPHSNRFSQLANTPQNAVYVTLGIAVVRTLLSQPQGAEYLAESKLVTQLSQVLSQVVSASPNQQQGVFLNPQKVQKTLSSDYFRLIGVMSAYDEGLALFHRFRWFSLFHRLMGLSERLDLIERLIENLDYSKPQSQARALLSRLLVSRSDRLKAYGTEFLNRLVRHNWTSSNLLWTLPLILGQMYDLNEAVSVSSGELLMWILTEEDDDHVALEEIVRMRPRLDHLGHLGYKLNMIFLTSSAGVSFLVETGFVQRELELWEETKNAEYVISAELSSEIPPRHFYADLVQTDEGCQIVEDAQYVALWQRTLESHGLEEEDTDALVAVKSTLWALGNVGSTSAGVSLVDEAVFELIIELSEDAPVHSVRGTCVHVLGLLSLTIEGIEILDSLGWESVFTPVGLPKGLCLPRDLEPFTLPLDDEGSSTSGSNNATSSSSHHTNASNSETNAPGPVKHLPPPIIHSHREILRAVEDLANPVRTSRALKHLSRLRVRFSAAFRDPSLFFRVIKLLSEYHYKQSSRRMAIDAFDLEFTLGTLQEVVSSGESLVRAQREAPGAEVSPNATRPQVSLTAPVDDGDASDDTEDDENTQGRIVSPDVKVLGFVVTF